MDEVKKSDFIYFQNEFLKDIKQIDIKYNEKFSQILNILQNEKLVNEQKFQIYNEKIAALSTAMETNGQIQQIKNDFEKFKERIKQEQLSNKNKLSYLERDLSDACFKYDNIFSSMISVPGLIGKGAKYSEIKAFYEFIDKKLRELIIFKDKNSMDLDKYKKKLETLIGQFKIQIDSSQSKYLTYCNEKIAETKKKIDEQILFFDEKINKLRLDNGKHSFDLIKKSEELENFINKFDNLSNEINSKLNEEMAKYQKYNNDLIKVFDSQREEFKIIKIRFTELSEFIKDVRFMRNLNNYSKQNNKEFDSVGFLKTSRNFSKKINFDKSQKITKDEENKYMNTIINKNNNDNTDGNDKNKNTNNINENRKDEYYCVTENNNKEIDIFVNKINENKIDESKSIEKKKDENKNDKKKQNIKLIVKEKDSNINITINSTFNNNSNVTRNNNNIINNHYTIESSTSPIKINKPNAPSLANKSRNYTITNNKTEKSVNKIDDKLKTQDSIFSTINQSIKQKLFIRTQSQFCLNNIIQNTEIKPKAQFHLTQNNFYQKNKKIRPFTLFGEDALSTHYKPKFKNLLGKGKKLEFDEILSILGNNNINDNLIHIEAYKYLNNKIIKIEEKIEEKMIEYTNVTKNNFEKMYKKIHLYIDLTNSLLIEIKKEKSKKNKKESNSPVKLYTNSEFNIPLIKKNFENNNINTDIKKIKLANNDNNTILNIQENKKVSSSKILSAIEPYLIKKFKSNG